MRVLVVDDEPSIADALVTALHYEGVDAEPANTGLEGLRRIREWLPDVVILDIMLPDLSGIEVARQLRLEAFQMPILFLSARDAVGDKVEGLASGGDDYVTKPFALAEIIARVNALARRASQHMEVDDVLRFADLQLRDATHEVWRGDESITLTATEFNLLRYFMQNPRRVLSKTQILDNVWHYDFGGDRNLVETYVSYLRKKIDNAGPSLIHTIRLVGYVLREP